MNRQQQNFWKKVAKGEIHECWPWQPCEVCGESKVQAHHSDYSKPLEVQWLCEKHHLQVHHKEKRC